MSYLISKIGSMSILPSIQRICVVVVSERKRLPSGGVFMKVLNSFGKMNPLGQRKSRKRPSPRRKAAESPQERKMIRSLWAPSTTWRLPSTHGIRSSEESRRFFASSAFGRRERRWALNSGSDRLNHRRRSQLYHWRIWDGQKRRRLSFRQFSATTSMTRCSIYNLRA